MDNHEDFTTLILAAGGAMAAAMGALFKTVVNLNKDLQRILREHGEMKHQVGKLEGERQGLERLAADVIEMVHKVLGRHQSNHDPEVAKFKNETDIEKLRRDLDL